MKKNDASCNGAEVKPSPDDQRWGGGQRQRLNESMAIDKMGGMLSGMVLSSPSSTNEQGEGRLRISIAGHSLPISAKVAAACLLKPETGDLVLLCGSLDPKSLANSGNWWVLSVLQRGQPALQATLEVAGAKIVALQGVQLNLTASNSIKVTAGDIAVNTLKTSWHTGSLQVVASTAHVVARQLTRMVHVFHSLADTITEHCRTKVTVVDEVHSTQSGSELIESKEAMLIKGGQVMLDAKQSVRIDGKHILMG